MQPILTIISHVTCAIYHWMISTFQTWTCQGPGLTTIPHFCLCNSSLTANNIPDLIMPWGLVGLQLRTVPVQFINCLLNSRPWAWPANNFALCKCNFLLQWKCSLYSRSEHVWGLVWLQLCTVPLQFIINSLSHYSPDYSWVFAWLKLRTVPAQLVINWLLYFRSDHAWRGWADYKIRTMSGQSIVNCNLHSRPEHNLVLPGRPLRLRTDSVPLIINC